MVGLLILGLACFVGLSSADTETCTAILAADDGQSADEKVLACQLFETALLVSEMSDAIVDGLESQLAAKGVAMEEAAEAAPGDMEKRKHEYLRFGKRKHEYLRFGKRKHEYLRESKRGLRFGKRKHEYLRFGKRKHEYLRFGKRSPA